MPAAISLMCGLTALGAGHQASLIVRGVVEARNAIESGQIELVIRSHYREALGPRGRHVEASYRIRFKGALLAVTRTETMPVILDYKLPADQKIDATMTRDPATADRLRARGVLLDQENMCASIFAQGVAYHLSGDRNVTLRDPHRLWRTEAFDPRLIGIAMSSSGHRYPGGPEKALGPHDAWKTVGTESHESGEVIILEKTVAQVTDRLWVVPQRQYFIERRETTGGAHEYVLQAEAARFSGVWFPKRVHLRRLVHDQLQSDEVVEITAAELNVPVADEVFSLAGLEAPVGAEVVDARTSQSLGVWDGERVSPFPPPSGPAIDMPPIGATTNWNRCLWAASAVLGVLALGLVWRRRVTMR